MPETGLPVPKPYAACVGANVGASMETASPPANRVLLLGAFQVIRNGAPLPLPRSRKARALLAYLALAPRPVTREKLCELFWDVADDPKSELRWCLSKLRPLVNGPAATRLIADRERVRIDTGSLDIDITKFMDTDKGPSWMTSAGVSFGASFDFHAGGAR